MSSLIGAILNTRGRFAAPMWAPVVNNLVVIVVGGFYVAIVGLNKDPQNIPAAGVQLLDHATVTAADRQTEAWKLSFTREGVAESTVTAQDVVVSAAPRSGAGIWDAIPAVRFLGTVAAPDSRLYRATQDGFWATAEI